MQEALDLVRSDLGPDAAVLHTREVSGGLFGWLRSAIEVTASATVNVPSRLPLDDDEHAEQTGMRRRRIHPAAA